VKTFKTELFRVEFLENELQPWVELKKLAGHNKNVIKQFFDLSQLVDFTLTNHHQFSKAEAVKVISKSTEHLYPKN
jgi:hypothetical protein